MRHPYDKGAFARWREQYETASHHREVLAAAVKRLTQRVIRGALEAWMDMVEDIRRMRDVGTKALVRLQLRLVAGRGLHSSTFQLNLSRL